MADSTRLIPFRFWLWLLSFIGLIVPQHLRADWRQAWKGELMRTARVVWVTTAGKFAIGC